MSPSPLFFVCLQVQPTHSLDRKSHRNSSCLDHSRAFSILLKLHTCFSQGPLTLYAPSPCLVHLLPCMYYMVWQTLAESERKKEGKEKEKLVKSHKVDKMWIIKLQCHLSLDFILQNTVKYNTSSDGDFFFFLMWIQFVTHITLPEHSLKIGMQDMQICDLN